MNKWSYIKIISQKSTKNGDKLLELMDRCGVNNLQEVTESAARLFCEELEGKNESDHSMAAVG